jgi:hypothetical protein
VGHNKGRAKGKVYAIRAYIKKAGTSQINNLMMHLKLLQRQEQTKPKTSRQKEIIKIRAEINENKTNRKLYKESIKQKSWIFEKINKINKPLTNIAKRKREKTQINTIKDGNGVF